MIVLVVVVSGCSLNVSITDLNQQLPLAPEQPQNQMQKLASLEGVSGSTGYETTAISKFKVKQSAGLLLNKHVTTTPNGFKVFLHASGRMTSEE